MTQYNPRLIQQNYCYSKCLPFLELRYSHNSCCAYKAHQHSEVSLGAIVTGSTQLTLNHAQRSYEIQSGELVVVAPDCVHSCNPIEQQPRSYYMLYIDYEWLQQQAKTILAIDQERIVFDTLLIRQPEWFALFLCFAQQFQSENYVQAEQTLSDLLHDLIPLSVQLNESDKLPMQHLQEIKQIYHQYLDRPPSVNALAKQYHICPETLIRQFKKQTGMSPNAYLNNVRVEKAKELLKEGQSISEVAYRLGFADQSHFQKIFTHYTAATPGQYRRGKSIFDKI